MPRIDGSMSKEEWRQSVREYAEQVHVDEEAREDRLAGKVTARLRARETAEGRADYWVLAFRPQEIKGPLSEDLAHRVVASMLASGRVPKLLKTVEDYE